MEYIYKDEEILLDSLLEKVYEVKENKYRLVQICCTSIKDHYELNYSFGKNYDFLNYKIKIKASDEVPSISNMFKPAFLYENEIKDLFSVNIKYISMDYQGHFYDFNVEAPYRIKEKEEGEEEDE